MLAYRTVAKIRKVNFVHNNSVNYMKNNASLNFSTHATLHPSFSLTDETFVKEYGVTSLRYTHKKTGADIISIIAPEDTNKVFSINFRTPASDSTGIAHVMEHSVLCGSKKYPVKEPFVDMMKGSLQTFLNAFTYPDRTCYPVASLNTKDFYNLIDVYMDGVLHPRAVTDDFVLKQEGWHYEAENIKDPLVFKGVVYNEMKGVYSSPESLLYKQIQQGLFPHNSYRHDAGGDPLNIPDLTMTQFKEFHRDFYHPSNAKIFFYGDDDPEKRLELIDGYLKDYNKSEHCVVKSRVKLQPKFEKPKYITSNYPIAPDGEEKHMLTVSWLLNEEKTIDLSPKEQLALGVLNHLLLGTSSSVLQKALTESKLGETVIGGGLSDELIQNTFSIGLKGITAGSGCGGTQGDESRNNESSCSDPLNGECKATPSGAGSCLTQDINYKLTMVEDVIYSTLKSAAKHGFDQSAIQASMNIIEFNLREFNTGSYPKGLMMMLGMLPSWIYRDCGAGTNSTTGSPIEAIQFETALQELKDDIAANNSSVFQELIEKYFVENSHRVVVHMAPDVDMEKRLVNQEEKVLADHKNGLKEEDLQLLVLETKKLKEVQLAEDSEEAKATIPKLTLEDIDRQEAVIPICVLPVAEFTSGSNSGGDGIVLKHDLHSNGILYVDVAFDYSSIPQQDLVLLPLFSRMLLECGTFSLSEEELHQLINTETGGIGISYKNDLKYTHNQIVAGNPEDSLLHLVIRGKCTSDKVPQLFDIINEVMSHAKLDNQKRFIEMLRETKAAKESGVINNGHSYAATRLASKMSFLGYLSEHTAGLTYVNNLSELLLAAEADWNSVLVRLENLRSIIYNNKKARDQTDPKYVVNLTGSPSILESNLTYSAVSHFCSNIPTKGEDVVQKAGLPTLRNWSPPATTTAIDNNGGGNMEGYLIPSQVNYVVKGGRLLQPDDKVGTHSELVETDKVRIGAFSVVSKLISNSYLWDHVRVVGGAYGASCSFGTASGRFLFSSYRDPNVLATLDAYDNTVEFLDNSLKLSGAMDQSEVDMVASMEDSSDTGIVIDHDVISQYVIGSIGDLDSPASPDQKGYRSMGEYLRGETNEHKQQYRDEIITTNINDFRTFHNKLKNMLKNADNHAVVLGSENSLIKANEKLKGDNKPKMKLEPAIQSIKP